MKSNCVAWGQPAIVVNGYYRGYSLEVFQNVHDNLFDGCSWAARAKQPKELSITSGASTMNKAKDKLIKKIDECLG